MVRKNQVVRWVVRIFIGLLVVVPWMLAATLCLKYDDFRRFYRHELKDRRCMAETVHVLERRSIEYENKWRYMRNVFGSGSSRVWDAIYLVAKTNELCGTSQMGFDSAPLCELCFVAMRNSMSEGFGIDGEEVKGFKERRDFRRWRDGKGSIYDLYISTNDTPLLVFEVKRPVAGSDRR